MTPDARNHRTPGRESDDQMTRRMKIKGRVLAIASLGMLFAALLLLVAHPLSRSAASSAAPCTGISCPSNISVSNTPDQCGAVVNYPAPTPNGSCGTITCVPPSGSFFPVGTTTVTCTSNGSPAQSCSFTVTVNDTQPPAITCPANIQAATTGNSAVVNYPVPTPSDNCPGATTTCTPPSGSTFPVGATTVTCTTTDNSSNTATCSFRVTVNQVSHRIADPLVCNAPGGIVTGTFTLTNNGNATTSANGTVTLPAGLLGLPGTGTASVGMAPTITATTVTYTNPALAPGQTAVVTYQAQIDSSVPTGTQLCSSLVVSFGGGPSLTVQACTTVNCPTVGPGTTPAAAIAVSDQKPGSVLFYNLYTSNPANLTAQNSRINITNTDPSRSVAVHLFFVDGASCTPADVFVCLTPNQTMSFLASDIDPGTTGYIVAVAADAVTGCPINFNFLIGDAFVKLASGHQANLAAESFAALTGTPPVCTPGSLTATLNFDGVSYNQVPRVLAVDNFPSVADGNNTLVILNRVGGNLLSGASNIGSLFGVLFDEAEQPLSFTLNSNACQFRFPLTNTSLRTVPRVETMVGAGRTGWLRLWGVSDIGLLGAVINFNATAGVNNFNQGHNLHKLTFTSASLTVPIIPPNCQ